MLILGCPETIAGRKRIPIVCRQSGSGGWSRLPSRTVENYWSRLSTLAARMNARERETPFSFYSLAFGRFVFRIAPHANEPVDQVIDRLMLLCVSPHPYQCVDEVVGGPWFFAHAANLGAA